jgi:3-phosphoshikimate 1-carboxyvinyltransferase
VMALSLAGMAIDGTTTIDTAEAMNVTFPTYAALMQSLGGNLELRKE